MHGNGGLYILVLFIYNYNYIVTLWQFSVVRQHLPRRYLCASKTQWRDNTVTHPLTCYFLESWELLSSWESSPFAWRANTTDSWRKWYALL